MAGRYVGIFTVTVPKEFTPQQKLMWTIVANGQTDPDPARMNTDYNVSPFRTPRRQHPAGRSLFDEKAAPVVGPITSPRMPIATDRDDGRRPLTLPLWAEDDAKYSSGSNAPMRNPPPPVEISWTKFRGPGTVTFDPARPKLEVLKGGKVDEPFAARTTTTAKFSEPGEYYLAGGRQRLLR